MSSIVLLALCVLAVVDLNQGEMTEEHKQMAKMLHTNCAKESNVNEDYITGASKGNFENDSNLKCYMKCVFVQMGVLSEDDLSIDREAFIEMVPEEIKDTIAKGLDKCLPLVGDDACEVAFNLNKCFYTFDPELMFTLGMLFIYKDLFLLLLVLDYTTFREKYMIV